MDWNALDQTIQAALDEDIQSGDVTSELLSAELVAEGHFVAKASGIIAGIAVAQRTFALVDPEIQFTPSVADGERVVRGQKLGSLIGKARGILSAERTALNFMQRMSGIATLTAQFVDAVNGTQATILDTRKTAPGLRLLDKWAVQLGGGRNHRMGLYDMVLIKDNHIAAAGTISAVLTQAMQIKAARKLPIEIEVCTLDQLREALQFDVDRIMLDNMGLELMREAVRITHGRVPLEASGNVNLNTVRAIAETGVDFISSGALTHSVTALDISLEIDLHLDR